MGAGDVGRKAALRDVNNDGGENAKRMLTLLRASEDEYAEMRRGR